MCTETTRILADKLEILEAVARYGAASDDLDPDGYASVFTEDGVLGEVVSRAAIREWVATRMQGRTARTRHLQTNTIFLELTADSARTRTTLLYTLKEPGAAPFIGTGFYLDEWRKTGAGWRIARRTATLDP